MNQFLIIVKGADAPDITPEQLQQRLALFGEWVQKVLVDRFVIGAPLEHTGHFLKSKTEVMTDGPFLESKEMISGYMIINAKDLEEATELTKECPLLGPAALEVRQLKPMA